MPPFYKGLSQGEMGLLIFVCILLTSIPGLWLAWVYQKAIFLTSAVIVGGAGAFVLPKGIMRKLTRMKSEHCHHYAAKRFHHWRHQERYIHETRRFATKRTFEGAVK